MGVKVNNISPETKKSFVSRLITAIALISIGVPAIIFGDWIFFFFILFCVVVAIYEFINAPHHPQYSFIVHAAMYILTISFVYWIFMKQSAAVYIDGHFGMSDLSVSTMGLTTLLCILFLFVLSFEKFDINDVCYLFTMAMFIGISFQSAYFIRYCPETVVDFHYDNHLLTSLLFFYVIAGALLSDLGAYATGILFGKHKMNPRISPKKTWEGFFGGIVISTIATVSFAFIADALGAPLLHGYLDLEHWYFVVAISIIMSVVSVLGDLMFSSIKRFYKIKDFGKMLPGHGGVLDRCDSMLITCLVVSLIILTLINFPFVAI